MEKLGKICENHCHFQAAKKFYEFSLQFFLQSLNLITPVLQLVTITWVLVHQQLDDFEKAKDYQELTLSITKKRLGPENVQVAACYNNLGSVHDKLGDLRKAKEYHQLALSIKQEKLGPENVQVAASFNDLGSVHEKLCDFEKAKKYHQLARSIYQKEAPKRLMKSGYSARDILRQADHEFALSTRQKKKS